MAALHGLPSNRVTVRWLEEVWAHSLQGYVNTLSKPLGQWRPETAVWTPVVVSAIGEEVIKEVGDWLVD